MFSRLKRIVQGREEHAPSGIDEITRQQMTENKENPRKRRDQEEPAWTDLQSASPPASLASLDEPSPFFIVGRAKSGTSWLRSIMDSHPEILCVNEGRIFGRDYRGRAGAMPRSLYGALADSEYLKTWVQRSPWSRGENTEEHLRNLTRHVTNYFMAEKLAKAGKKFAGDKTPLISMEVIAEIAEIYPDARVIHIVRDGRDVTISSMHHIWNNATDRGGHNDLQPDILAKRDAYRKDPEGFLVRGESIFVDGQLAATARNWRDLTARAAEDGPVLLGQNYTEVRYEDLLEAPLKEVERLLRFLGADHGAETVKRCVEATSFERVAKRKRGQEDSSSFFRKGVAGDWRSVFTEEDKRVFKEAAGGLLVELGYESDNDW